MYYLDRSDAMVKAASESETQVVGTSAIEQALGSEAAFEKMMQRLKESSETGAFFEFRQQVQQSGKVFTKADTLDKLRTEDVKQMFDSADKDKKGRLNWLKKEITPFMDAVLKHFGLPRPKGGEMAFYKMFKAAAQQGARSISFNESMSLVRV